jgi:hypothetical protein
MMGFGFAPGKSDLLFCAQDRKITAGLLEAEDCGYFPPSFPGNPGKPFSLLCFPAFCPHGEKATRA